MRLSLVRRIAMLERPHGCCASRSCRAYQLQQSRKINVLFSTAGVVTKTSLWPYGGHGHTGFPSPRVPRRDVPPCWRCFQGRPVRWRGTSRVVTCVRFQTCLEGSCFTCRRVQALTCAPRNPEKVYVRRQHPAAHIHCCCRQGRWSSSPFRDPVTHTRHATAVHSSVCTKRNTLQRFKDSESGSTTSCGQ